MDAARAYEIHAAEFLEARDQSLVGVDIVAHWARTLSAGTETVEIGCGGGYPITRALVDAGLSVWAIDASPTLLESFRARFPDIPTQCSSVLESDCFGRKFGAVVSIGLIFLLKESEQIALLRRVSDILLPGGRFLFTAPVEAETWQDIVTGHSCQSLGRDGYVRAMNEAGLRLVSTCVDQGDNNYYEAEKLRSGTRRHSRGHIMTNSVSAGKSDLRAWLRTPSVQVGALTILGLIVAVWVLLSTYWTFWSEASEMSIQRLLVVWGLGLIAWVLLARAAWNVKRRPRRDVDEIAHDV